MIIRNYPLPKEIVYLKFGCEKREDGEAERAGKSHLLSCHYGISISLSLPPKPEKSHLFLIWDASEGNRVQKPHFPTWFPFNFESRYPCSKCSLEMILKHGMICPQWDHERQVKWKTANEKKNELLYHIQARKIILLNFQCLLWNLFIAQQLKKKKSKYYHAGRHWNLLEWLNNVDNTAALPSTPPLIQTINILLFY